MNEFAIKSPSRPFCYEKEPGHLAETYEGTAEIYQYPVYMGKGTR